MRTLKFCSCRICKKQGKGTVHPITHAFTPGAHIPAGVWKAHQESEAKLRDLEAIEAEKLVLGATFRDHPPGNSIPVRHSEERSAEFSINLARSMQTEGEEASDVTTTGVRPTPILGATERLLALINSDLDKRTNAFYDRPLKLSFEREPTSLNDIVPPISCSNLDGQAYLKHRNWIEQTLRTVHAAATKGDGVLDGRKNGLTARLQTEILRLDDVREDHWRLHSFRVCMKANVIADADGIKHDAPLIDTEKHFNRAFQSQPFILVALLVVVGFDTLGGVSHPKLLLLLSMLQALLTGAFIFCNRGSDLTAEQNEILDSMPTDYRTALKKFDLEPEIIPYACCPTCFSIYAPLDNHSKPPLYPDRCTFRDTISKDDCGALLIRLDDGCGIDDDPTTLPADGRKPVKTFGFQKFESWIARLFSRPHLEEYIDSAWDVTPPGTDIWGADVIRKFKGPDNKPFSIRPPGNSHLIFSLFVDWFNPYGNKQAGKSYSTGAIYMICLNLPLHMRYSLENVYLVGIIPGPKEPSLEQINHLLRPLVDSLLQFWRTGFLLSRTWLYPLGRLVRGALIPLVCDLPATRKTAGFTGHGATMFCSFCRLPRAEIDNVNQPSWPRRYTWEEHMAHALRWRDAPTQALRTKIEKRHGIRWSELLRLPYWDPTQYTALDAMHNLFLGEFQHHCRNVWEMDIKGKKKRVLDRHDTATQARELQKGIRAIVKGSKGGLMNLRKGYVVALAHENGVMVTGATRTKADFAKAILGWYNGFGENKPLIATPPIVGDDINEEGIVDPQEEYDDLSIYRVISKEVMEAIQSDIAKTSLPSWIERPPQNFGSPSHGKLKADHWRTVCTVSLVVTLVRLWGRAGSSDWEKKLLRNYLDLVIAVQAATKRSVSPEQISIYQFYMRRYLKTLVELFSDHHIVPNHHLSLHLDECLSRFGPVHSWWCFPFERYNGVISRLNTNHKPGQMEITFLETFCRGINFRALLPFIHLPDTGPYQKLWKKFMLVFGSQIQGTFFSDVLAFTSPKWEGPKMVDSKKVPLPLDIYEGLLGRLNLAHPSSGHSAYTHAKSTNMDSIILDPQAQFVPKVKSCGIPFTLSSNPSKAVGNSYVTFRDPLHNILIDGQIESIFLHRRKVFNAEPVVEPFLVVREFKPLSPEDANHDPFRIIEHLDAILHYESFSDRKHVLRLSDVQSHFASYRYVPEEIGKKCILVRSIDRVRNNLSWSSIQIKLIRR